MNTTKTLLKHVTIERLKDYLVGKGWTQEPFGRETVLLFIAPPQKRRPDWDVLIPAYPELFDYDRVVEIAIDVVAAFEDRSDDDVLSDILPSALVELIELRALIADCERLILKHGDDFALGLSLVSLKTREQNLAERS
jgi:hypothetical protein